MSKKYLTISLARREKLEVPFPATWVSNNPLVQIKGQGWISASKDTVYPSTIATITATEIGGIGRTQVFEVTIVPWSANRITLEVEEKLAHAYNITKSGNKLYVSVRATGLELFESTDGLKTLTKVCDLPAPQWYCPMLITPNGYFIRTIDKVYHSTDLQTWTLCMTASPGTNCLMHSFDFYHNQTTGTTYVYTSEYHTDASHKSKVYRGVILSNGTQTWTTILEHYSRNELVANPSLFPACWHTHLIITDKQTGHVWLGTGDTDKESIIQRSTDNGTTWQLFGTGSQEWRALSIWFTANYIYWNMDADINQQIFRVPRTWLATKTVQEINSGKETVALLTAGTMWYHMWGKDDFGNNVVYMCCTPEGGRRDNHARIYMIREKTDGTVETEEVMLVQSSNPESYMTFLQMEPYAQDDAGYIYMNGRLTPEQTTWKLKIKRYGKKLLYKFANPKFV